MSHPVVFRPLQARFLTIPQAPLCYWLRERFFDLLAGRTLGEVAEVCQGLATASDPRFVRFTWEVPAGEWGRPMRGRRWVPFEKGGGYGKWFGHHFWAVDWEHDGARIKLFPPSVIRNESYYFKEGWTYSYMARGSLGLRHIQGNTIFSHLASTIFFRDFAGGAAVIKCRFASSAVRSLSAKIQLNESYVSRVPLLDRIPDSLAAIECSCIVLKQHLVGLDPTERTFAHRSPRGATLTKIWQLATGGAEAVAATLHTLEGLCEREVFDAYGIAGEDLQAVLDETGTPAGWFPRIAGYEAPPELPGELVVEPKLLERLAHEQRCTASPDALADLRRRLRTIYEAGPGAQVEDETAVGEGDENDAEEQEMVASGARIPIPTETFLEELSQKIEVHPISVYWLLRELRKEEGVVSLRELRRYVEDYFTVMILCLLGHRWRKQMEGGEPVPQWADPDGIIPLTDGTGERTLLDRVRERVAAEFGEGRVDAIEQEFRQIMGCSLADWLARDFFPHHLSQFKRRPIAWLLESGRALDTRWAAASSRRGRRSTRAGGPAFACLVYYHKLTADTLSRLKTHYLRPVLQRREFELAEERRRAAEGDVGSRAAAERAEGGVDELKAFEAALDTVSAQGFWSRRLTDLLGHEAADHWARRTPKGAMPDQEAFLRQEQAYDPDLNDGVRVNIAPLQRYRLLAADVLASKDIDRAIEDRARWRADERRWCREGKLPKPGWWQDRD